MSDYIDTINRQEAIDAFNEQNWKLSDIPSYPICKEIRKAAQDTIRSLPPAQQQTLYGYKIEHLAYIARVMEKEGITAEYAARTFDDMSRAIRMIIDETQQKLEEVTKRGYKVVHVSTDSIKVADAVDEPKSACSDCQEFDCYGCEHKEESK